MPELPEVEVIRRGLRARVTGRRIEAVRVLRDRATRRHEHPDELVTRMRGRVVDDVGRRGKFLVLRLDGPDALVIHLGMSGQLLLDAPVDPPHTAVVFELDSGPPLRFVDPRTFGLVYATEAGRDGALPPALAHLGADALEHRWSPSALSRVLGPRSYRLKPLLLDQRVIAGIGNIYADEILFAARLRFDRPGSSLGPSDLGRLSRAIRVVLEAAVEHGGSSLADAQYVDAAGALGSYQLHHRVYGRAGQPCARCGSRSAVVRSLVIGRSTFFCPRCQR